MMILDKNRLWNLNLFLKELSPCIFFFFNLWTLKFELWRHRLDNTFTRFRAYDRVLHPVLQFLIATQKKDVFFNFQIKNILNLIFDRVKSYQCECI